MSERVALPRNDRNACCAGTCHFMPYCDSVDICQACGLGRTMFNGRLPELQDYIRQDDDGRAAKAARLQSIYDRYLRHAPPGSLLDIGCAEGVLLSIADAAGWRVAGLDSHARHDEGQRIITGRFLEHDFNERFDAVTMVHSFEHMDDPKATLRKCRSLIERGGRLLIVVPNFGGWWARAMRGSWQWLNVDDHRYHYTQRALAALLEQAGFRVELCRTTSAFAPSLPEMILSAKGVFDWPALRWRAARSVVYRLSNAAGIICNPLADFAGQGAEIQVLARPV